MKRIIIFCSLLMGLTLQLAAQTFTIKGTVKTKAGADVANASVILKNTNLAAVADSTGYYHLNVPAGNYALQVTAIGFLSATKEIKVNSDLTINITLADDPHQLADVKVQAKKEKTFGVTRLKAVEGTTINAGKKSEVIVMSDITANTASNNSRQIYSKVAGLNIWENDGAGLQLGIGGRGLNPNRVTNFNTRQNGYDISADALGYPESYYTPPAELVDRIEILRGASSLQYGTQFGGLINFKLKNGPTDKPIEVTSRETTGSWGFFNTTNSIGGTVGKVQYYTFFQHKQGDGWRPNSDFNANTGYAAATYKATDKLSVTFQYTHMDYLAHQPGGLTDAEFNIDPHQSIRARNWFKVKWNLGAATLDYKFSDHLKFNTRFFVLDALRDAVGNLDNINRADPGNDRDLYKDTYKNWGNESRLLYTYKLGDNPQNLLVGFRYYHGHTDRRQGLGNNASTGTPADFDYNPKDDYAFSSYTFPNHNIALFAENIFRLSPKFSIIPGIRFESIYTQADGFHNNTVFDQSGNLIFSQQVNDNLRNNRNFLIGGIGLSYYKSEGMQFYGNISQNYRAINFNDLYSNKAGIRSDPNIKDETGYSADAGMRGNIADVFNYDLSVFTIYYNNRIGTYESSDANFNDFRYRTNIGKSRNYGFESFAEYELLHLLRGKTGDNRLSIFSNLALIDAKYIASKESAFNNRKVELVPNIIFKGGLDWQYKRLSANYQFSYTSSQYTDATNSTFTSTAVNGLVPAYTVMDVSAKYKLSKLFTLEGSVNNLADARYFTRRADSYPGPGIVPSDARSFFLTLQVKL